MSDEGFNLSKFLNEINDKVIKGIEQNKPLKLMPTDIIRITTILKSMNLYNLQLLSLLHKKELINIQEMGELNSWYHSNEADIEKIITSVMSSYVENIDE